MSHLTKSSEVHLAALALPTSALLLLHLPTTWVVLGRRPRRRVGGARLHQDAVRARLGWAAVLAAEVAWKEQVSVQDNMTEGNNHQTRANTHLSCKMHNCHILVLRAFGNQYILRTYSLFWSRLVYIILNAVNTDQSYLITSSFKQSRFCKSITYLLHSAQPSSALFYTFTLWIKEIRVFFFSPESFKMSSFLYHLKISPGLFWAN